MHVSLVIDAGWPFYRRRKRAMPCVANRIAVWLLQWAMLWRAPPHRSTSARWLLVAWLCVLLTSVVAPFAKAQPPAGWEPVCSATGSALWVLSPTAVDEAAPQGHGLDCALCLPMLAPPPAQLADGGQGAPMRALAQCGKGVSHVFASTLPPARAPPFQSL